MRRRDDRGSTIPLVLGFFLIAAIVVAGSVALGQAFVQQRDLQDTCDGAAAAAAASAADLDRAAGAVSGTSLTFAHVQREVDAYLARDPARHGIRVAARMSRDHTRITLTCRERSALVFGQFFGRRHVWHTVTSSARSAVLT